MIEVFFKSCILRYHPTLSFFLLHHIFIRFCTAHLPDVLKDSIYLLPIEMLYIPLNPSFLT